MWAWGNNEFGQLGQGDTLPRKGPQRVKIVNGPVIKVAAGNDHNVVLMATGEVFAFNRFSATFTFLPPYNLIPLIWRPPFFGEAKLEGFVYIFYAKAL